MINSLPELLLQACAPLPAALAPRWLDPGLLPPSSPFQHHMAPASPSPVSLCRENPARSPWSAPDVGLSSHSGLQPPDWVGLTLRDREGHGHSGVVGQTDRATGRFPQVDGAPEQAGVEAPRPLLSDEG